MKNHGREHVEASYNYRRIQIIYDNGSFWHLILLAILESVFDNLMILLFKLPETPYV